MISTINAEILQFISDELKAIHNLASRSVLNNFGNCLRIGKLYIYISKDNELVVKDSWAVHIQSGNYHKYLLSDPDSINKAIDKAAELINNKSSVRTRKRKRYGN